LFRRFDCFGSRTCRTTTKRHLAVAGGVAVHTLWAIKQPAFIQRFKHKGRFAEFMGRIPIHVVVSPAGLAGAAACGLENFAKEAE
jgi:glucokinase